MSAATSVLEGSSRRVFTPSDLADLYFQAKTEVGLPTSIYKGNFVKTLEEKNLIQEITLESAYGNAPKRYGRDGFSHFELAMSLYSASRRLSASG